MDRRAGDGEYLLRGYTGRMFLVLTLGLATVRLGRRALPPLLPAVIADLSITPLQAGLVLTTATVCLGLLQYPSGRIADRLSRKTALLASTVTIIVGALLVAGAPTYAALLVGAAVIGAGEGLYGPAARALLSDLFVAKRGRAFGYHTVASDIGGILAAGIATAALAIATWRGAFLPGVLAAGAVAALVYAWGREPIRLRRIELGLRSTAGRLFGQPNFRLLVVAYVLFNFTVQGVTGFLPTLLRVEHGFSPGLANATFALLFAVGLFVRPVAGELSDRIPRLFVGVGGVSLSALGIAGLVLATSPAMAIGGVVVYALGMKAFPPSMQAHLMDAFPDDNMGGDLGATRTVYLGIGSLGPAYVGYVAGEASYTLAFSGFVACLLAAGAIGAVLLVGRPG